MPVLVADCAVTASFCCSKIAEAEAAVSVNEKNWLVMQVSAQAGIGK
jgi:hypothetical protein